MRKMSYICILILALSFMQRIHGVDAVFKISNPTSCRFLLHHDKDSYVFEPGQIKTLSFSATSENKRAEFRFFVDVECDPYESERTAEFSYYMSDSPLLKNKIVSGSFEAFAILEQGGTSNVKFKMRPALIFTKEFHIIEKLDFKPFPTNSITMTLDDGTVWVIYWPMSADAHYSLDQPVEKIPQGDMFRLRNKDTDILFIPVGANTYRGKFWGNEARGY